jgi:hypothetical protein
MEEQPAWWHPPPGGVEAVAVGGLGGHLVSYAHCVGCVDFAGPPVAGFFAAGAGGFLVPDGGGTVTFCVVETPWTVVVVWIVAPTGLGDGVLAEPVPVSEEAAGSG